MHGLARLRFWHLLEVQATAAAVNFEFSLTNDAEMRTQWPSDFSLQASLHIGRTLDLCLKTTNTGSRAFPVTEALHTYLRVGDIRQVTVRGLDGQSYRDTVGTVTTRHQEGDIVIDREVDRQYDSRGPVVVEDRALKRQIHIANEGSNTVVVWNPWIEKSTRLADLPNNDYPRFLCIEAANVGPAIMIDPGQTHEIRTQISVE
jgi:glucose-6-phosphate 1-epimerase